MAETLKVHKENHRSNTGPIDRPFLLQPQLFFPTDSNSQVNLKAWEQNLIKPPAPWRKTPTDKKTKRKRLKLTYQGE